MNIPKIISKNEHKYIFVKEYPSHILYKDIKTGVKVSFKPYDLGLIQPVTVRPRLRKDMNMKL